MYIAFYPQLPMLERTLHVMVAMLLVLGTVFGGKSDNQTRLVWARSLPASASDQQLQRSLEENGLAFDVMSRPEAESQWQTGKLIAMLEGEGGQYELRVNSYFGLQGRQIEALVQQGFLISQARAQGAMHLSRIPVVKSSPGGRGERPYVAYLLPGLLGLNLLMIGVFSAGVIDVRSVGAEDHAACHRAGEAFGCRHRHGANRHAQGWHGHGAGPGEPCGHRECGVVEGQCRDRHWSTRGRGAASGAGVSGWVMVSPIWAWIRSLMPA